jgi:NADP-dependent 3-hydroxy acid dehydrogenase YdfG
LQSLLGRHHSYAQDNIEAASKHFDMAYPKPGPEMLDNYITRLVEQGLLPTPPTTRTLGGRVAVVTGASSGIGQAVAVALAESGATVVLVARGAEKLQQIASNLRGAVPIVCDVTSREAVQAMVNEVQSNYQRIDVLVNCAGVMYFTLMKNCHYQEWDSTIDINCKGVVNVCGVVFPLMLQSKSGHIVNISSDAAKTVFPALTVYNASKAFVRMFSKGLRAECVGTGVRVTDVQPGDTATNLIMRNSDSEAAEKVGVSIGQKVGTGSDRSSVLDPQDIASAVLYAVSAPEHVGIHEILIEPRDQMFGDPTAMATAAA